MKYLQNYIEQGQTEAFTKHGAFFAFSKSQLAEQREEGVAYQSIGNGLICPTHNVNDLIDDLDLVHSRGIKQDIAENGLSKIIQRELHNHEAQITYDMEDTKRALEGYPIDDDMMTKEWTKFIAYCRKHDMF